MGEMGESGVDEFARETTRSITATALERAAKAELETLKLSKELLEVQAALQAALAAKDQPTSPAPGEMGAQSGGVQGTGSEMGGSDTASTKTESTETASPKTPEFFFGGEGESTEERDAARTPALRLLGTLSVVEITDAEEAARLAEHPLVRHALATTRTAGQLEQAGRSLRLVTLQCQGRPLVAFALSEMEPHHTAEMAVLQRAASLLGGSVQCVQAQYCASEGVTILELEERYLHGALQQVLSAGEHGWLDLAEIATQSESPSDAGVRDAIQHLVQGDDKQRGRAVAKVVLLTRNWTVGPRLLQQTLANWATLAHFCYTAERLVQEVESAEAAALVGAAQQEAATVLPARRKDTRDPQALRKELTELWSRLSKSQRKTQRKRVQTTADYTEPRVSEHLGAQMVRVQVSGDGTCALAAAAFILTGHTGAADYLAAMVQEALLMHDELLDRALEDARAERNLPALTLEEYLEHIRTGTQWSGESELTAVALLLQIQVVVWAEQKGEVYPHYLGGTPQEGQEAFTQVMHLYLEGGHYSPLVAAAAAQSGSGARPPMYLMTLEQPPTQPQDESDADARQASRTPSPPSSATATKGSPHAHTMSTAGSSVQTQKSATASAWGPPVTYPAMHSGAGAHAGSGGQGGQGADAGGRREPVRNYRTQNQLKHIQKLLTLNDKVLPPEGLLLKVVHRTQGVTGERQIFRLTMRGTVETLLQTTQRFNSSEVFLMAANQKESTFFGLEGHDQGRYDREQRVLAGHRHLWDAQDVLTHLDAGGDPLELFDPGTDSDSDSGSERRTQRAARPIVDPRRMFVTPASERSQGGQARSTPAPTVPPPAVTHPERVTPQTAKTPPPPHAEAHAAVHKRVERAQAKAQVHSAKLQSAAGPEEKLRPAATAPTQQESPLLQIVHEQARQIARLEQMVEESVQQQQKRVATAVAEQLAARQLQSGRGGRGGRGGGDGHPVSACSMTRQQHCEPLVHLPGSHQHSAKLGPTGSPPSQRVGKLSLGPLEDLEHDTTPVERGTVAGDPVVHELVIPAVKMDVAEPSQIFQNDLVIPAAGNNEASPTAPRAEEDMQRLAHQLTELKADMQERVAAAVATQLAAMQSSIAPPPGARMITEPPPTPPPPLPDPLKELSQAVGELQMAIKGMVEELRAPQRARETPPTPHLVTAAHTATTAQGALAPRKEATGHTAAAALNAQAATWRPLLPPPQKAQRSALQEGENTGEPTPTRHTLVWPELHYGHQHLSISVTQREQLQVLADRPGSADAAKALLQHRLRVAVQQLPATMKVALERDIPLNAEGGVTSSYVIGRIPVIGRTVGEACGVCTIAAAHTPRRWCSYRRGGPDAQEEWQDGPQAQLERLHHGPVCSKCTGANPLEDAEWLVYDPLLAAYRLPTPTENQWGVQGTADKYWAKEENLSAFNQLPSHVASQTPSKPPREGRRTEGTAYTGGWQALGQTSARERYADREHDEHAEARGAHDSREKEEYDEARRRAQREKSHYETKKGFIAQTKNVITIIDDSVMVDCYSSAKGEALLAADKQLDTVMNNHRPELNAYLAALEALGEPAHYTVCRELVYTLSAPGSKLRTRWDVDTEGHQVHDKRWETPNKAVHTWLLGTLIRTEEERNHVMTAAKARVSSFATMEAPPAPRQVADQMLRQRKLCRAISRGEHLTLPVLAYWWGQALPHQVRSELAALIRTNQMLKTGITAHWDTLPSDYAESDFWKLVNLAEEIFNQVSAAQPTGARRRNLANQITEDQHASEDEEAPTDTAHALRPVGPTGPKRAPFQQPTDRRWNKYRPRPEIPQGAAGPSTLQRQGPSAFAVVGDPHYQGCWGCGSKEHLKRDCPHKLDQENAVVKALQTSVTSGAPMAEQVSRDVLCVLAAQGCTADLEDHLTPQQCWVVGDFIESGQPECLMKVYKSS